MYTPATYRKVSDARCAASSSSSSHQINPHTPDSEANIQPHRRNSNPPSRHKLFYRDIVPPMFRVLALGSAVYFSLHLIWQYLDGREQKGLEDEVKTELEEQVRRKLEGRGVEQGSSDRGLGSSWWTWLSGKDSGQIETRHSV